MNSNTRLQMILADTPTVVKLRGCLKSCLLVAKHLDSPKSMPAH